MSGLEARRLCVGPLVRSRTDRYGNRTLGLATTGAASGAGATFIKDTVWVEDSLPAGATGFADGGDNWTWVSSNPTPVSGSSAHQSNIAAGTHQHYFTGATATMPVSAGDKLYAYVYLDPANMPSEVMLQWNENGSWEHRVNENVKVIHSEKLKLTRPSGSGVPSEAILNQTFSIHVRLRNEGFGRSKSYDHSGVLDGSQITFTSRDVHTRDCAPHGTLAQHCPAGASSDNAAGLQTTPCQRAQD